MYSEDALTTGKEGWDKIAYHLTSLPVLKTWLYELHSRFDKFMVNAWEIQQCLNPLIAELVKHSL